MKNLRLIVTTSDGKKSEVYVPLDTSSNTERGWKSVAIPLQAITGFDRTNKIVKEIAFSGDGTSTFFVGDLRVVNDSTPIHGEIENQSSNFAVGDTVTFHATGSGGASVLKYSWDFGAGNGIATDAVGQTVARKFRKPGKYHITLTITDLYGLKPPYSCSMDVTVND
jgi:PKD repeat protein